MNDGLYPLFSFLQAVIFTQYRLYQLVLFVNIKPKEDSICYFPPLRQTKNYKDNKITAIITCYSPPSSALRIIFLSLIRVPGRWSRTSPRQPHFFPVEQFCGYEIYLDHQSNYCSSLCKNDFTSVRDCVQRLTGTCEGGAHA